MRMADRNVDHVDMNISVRGITVMIRAIFHVFFRLFDLALLHDLFALDHTAAAILAAVLAFLAAGATARAALVVFDLRAGDLLFRLLLGPESDA